MTLSSAPSYGSQLRLPEIAPDLGQTRTQSTSPNFDTHLMFPAGTWLLIFFIKWYFAMAIAIDLNSNVGRWAQHLSR